MLTIDFDNARPLVREGKISEPDVLKCHGLLSQFTPRLLDISRTDTRIVAEPTNSKPYEAEKLVTYLEVDIDRAIRDGNVPESFYLYLHHVVETSATALTAMIDRHIPRE